MRTFQQISTDVDPHTYRAYLKGGGCVEVTRMSHAGMGGGTGWAVFLYEKGRTAMQPICLLRSFGSDGTRTTYRAAMKRAWEAVRTAERWNKAGAYDG